MYKKITVGAFLLSQLLFFTLTFLFPRDERASVLENRPLADMPSLSAESLFSGKFGSLYEEYLSDNVGLRSHFTTLGSRFEKLLGFTIETQGQLVTPQGGSTLALYDGKIMEIFEKNDAVRQMYISVVNKYAEILPDGTQMYLMLVPTQIEFDTSPYAELSDSQAETIADIYSKIEGITPINVYDSLKAHSGEYIYFRTDHHWTQRGAYLGYEAIAKTLGIEPVPLNDMEADRRSGFLGYLYNQANVPEYAIYADNIEFFLPGKNYTVSAKNLKDGEIVDYSSLILDLHAFGQTPSYGIFMGGDHPFCRVDTDVKNGKTALIIKDSYANALLPFLTNHYETLLVVDPRNYYGTVSELFMEHNIDDVFLINYAFSSTFESIAAAIDKIR